MSSRQQPTQARSRRTALQIRQARVSDAQALIDHACAVATEPDNLTFGPGEFDVTLDQQKRFLDGLKGSASALYLVAMTDQSIVGSLTLHRGKRPRVAHEAEFGMSVRRSGKGWC